MFARLLSVVVIATGICAPTWPSKAAGPCPTSHLVLDDRLVAAADGLRLVLGTVEKDPHNPLIQADKPWENALNNLYPNVIYDDEAGLFKLWYKCVLADKDVIARMMPPSTVHDVGWFLLYATSADGVQWQKPELGLIGFDGSTRNNIVARDTPNVGVFKDLHDTDARRRYKMIYDVGSGQMRVRFSADGLHWSEPVVPTGLGRAGDTHNNAFWDARSGKYVLLTRYFLGERLVYRSESDDFLAWQTPAPALRSTPEEGKARQTYCMPAFAYGSGYVGLVMMYRAAGDRSVDCELAWSADSVRWRRVLPGVALIPRGPKGSYDSKCIYAQANPPLVQGGKLLIYYGGSAVEHRGWKRHCLPCLARLRLDGFAAYTPAEGRNQGTLTTRPVRCTRESLRVNVEAGPGLLRVAVVGVEGFGLDQCEPVTGDSTAAVVRWNSGKDLSQLHGREVQLQFELDRAKLYSVSGVELTQAK